jgi:hypothetical protein
MIGPHTVAMNRATRKKNMMVDAGPRPRTAEAHSGSRPANAGIAPRAGASRRLAAGGGAASGTQRLPTQGCFHFQFSSGSGTLGPLTKGPNYSSLSYSPTDRFPVSPYFQLKFRVPLCFLNSFSDFFLLFHSLLHSAGVLLKKIK